MTSYGPFKNESFTTTKPESEGINAAIEAQIKHYLSEFGLGQNMIEIQEIDNQTLEELQENLKKVDAIFVNPHQDKVLRLEYNDVSGVQFIQHSLIPLLTEMKNRILARIGKLKADKKLENISDLAKEVSEGEIRLKLEKEIESLKENFKQLEQTLKPLNLETDIELSRLTARTSLFERRSKIWLSFFERESVATITGGILLLIIAIALIIAMFVHISPPDILTNSLLLILGYFFGQSVAKSSTHTRKEDEP